MRRWLTVALVASLWVSPLHAQAPDDDALLDLAGPKGSKPAPRAPAPSEGSASKSSGAAPSVAAEGPGAEPTLPANSAEVRRARRESRNQRRKSAEAATGAVQSSSVAPADAKSVEPSGAEKGAARETAVDTIVNDPKTAATVAREAKPAPARGKRRAEKEKPPRPARKKSAYDIARESWHAAAPPEMCAQFKSTAIPDLVLHIQGKDLTYVLRPQSRQGGWDEGQLAIAKEAFGSWPGGPTPHPRTLDLVYAATLQFGCPYVTLISGVRKDRGGSRHSHGLAADIVLPGVDDEELAAYFRAQGFVGVGTYPRAGFVHVDTRDQSFFWIDRSKPNQHGRVVQVRKDESTAADEAARARGMTGFVNPPRLQKALRVRAVRKLKAHRAKQEREAARGQSAAAP
jgi:hypothetical protein